MPLPFSYSSLSDVRRCWEHLARHPNHLWAILSDHSQSSRTWDPDAFFAAGVKDIKRIRDHAATPRIGVDLKGEQALDFGCGVGRLTRALAPHFDKVHGVDIAPTMIARAREFRPPPNCDFHVHAPGTLDLFPDAMFDFVCSLLTLQHLPQQIAINYISEFLRVLRPGGILVMQHLQAVDGQRVSIRWVHERWRDISQSFRFASKVRLFDLPPQLVESTLEHARGVILDRLQADLGTGWHSLTYYVRLRAG